jgi:hypothetical protein
MPFGHHGTREDARGSSRCSLALQPMARRRAAVHRQRRAAARIVVGGGKGIAIDGGVGVGRHRERSDGRRSQRAPCRLGQVLLLDAHHRCHPLLQDGQRLVVAQALLVVRKAVVDQLAVHGHQACRQIGGHPRLALAPPLSRLPRHI